MTLVYLLSAQKKKNQRDPPLRIPMTERFFLYPGHMSLTGLISIYHSTALGSWTISDQEY